MRAVFVHLRDATEDEVAEFLSRTYPTRSGPPWIHETRGEPVLWIDFYRDARREFEPEEWRRLAAALGREPATSVVAEVSGRHLGQAEARAFALALLGQFAGVAWDDYALHDWTAVELRGGVQVQGHVFFDYRE